MGASFDKKVMIISNSVSGGGAEISMMRLFSTLIDLKVDVVVCAINEDAISKTPVDGVTVIGRKWGAGLMSTLRSFQDFRTQLHAFNPDTLIVNCELPELYVALSAPLRMRIIAVEHTSRPWDSRRVLGGFVRSILKIRRATWVTVSRDQTQIWPTSSTPQFIPNSHVLDKATEGAIEVDIVFVGRLNNSKHPEIVANAVRQTKSTAVFFGDGPNLLQLKDEYRDTDLQFFGFVDAPWTQISSNSIVIVASEFEGDGMNIVEAVANNNPILLADNIDLKRFNFPEKNYFKTPEDLNSKILEAKRAGLEQFRISSVLRSKLLEERDPIRVARKWIEILEGGSQI